MNLKPHAFSTGLLAIVATFLFMFLFTLFYEYVIYDNFTPNNRYKQNIDKPLKDEEESYSKIYPVSSQNNPVIQFYSNELKDYMQDFINATERYDIFKTRIQYGLALECINKELKQHQIDWRGKSDNYRRNFRNNYANSPQKIQQSKDNESFLFKNEKIFDFDLIKDIEVSLLYPTNLHDKSLCDQQVPIVDMYPQFINYYLERYDTVNRSREWYRSLERYHPDFFAKKKRKKNVEYKKQLKTKKEFERKIERRKEQEWSAKRNKESFLMLKENLLSLENNQSIDNFLFDAVREQNIKAVELLLKKNADMYTMDEHKLYTAFSYACLSNPLKPNENKIDLVKLFLKNNVDVNYQHNKSETALTQASKGCHNLPLVKLLLDHGANPDIKDRYGFTTRNGLFRHCRDKKKYQKMMKLLDEYYKKNKKPMAIKKARSDKAIEKFRKKQNERRAEDEVPKMDRYYDRNEEACINDDRSYRYACFVAGERYIYFNKGEMDKGLKYWEMSCKEREYGTACYFLAKVYLNKQNGKFFSKNKAFDTFEFGCRLGEKNSINLGCKQGVEICCQDRI